MIIIFDIKNIVNNIRFYHKLKTVFLRIMVGSLKNVRKLAVCRDDLTIKKVES